MVIMSKRAMSSSGVSADISASIQVSIELRRDSLRFKPLSHLSLVVLWINVVSGKVWMGLSGKAYWLGK